MLHYCTSCAPFSTISHAHSTTELFMCIFSCSLYSYYPPDQCKEWMPSSTPLWFWLFCPVWIVPLWVSSFLPPVCLCMYPLLLCIVQSCRLTRKVILSVDSLPLYWAVKCIAQVIYSNSHVLAQVGWTWISYRICHSNGISHFCNICNIRNKSLYVATVLKMHGVQIWVFGVFAVFGLVFLHRRHEACYSHC